MKRLLLIFLIFQVYYLNFTVQGSVKSGEIDDTVKITNLLKQIRQNYSLDKTQEASDSTNLYLALLLSRKAKFIRGEAQCYDILGIRERNQAHYSKALEYHFKAYELIKETTGIREQAIILNNIGVVYRRIDDYVSATEYHLKALKLAEQINDIHTISVSLNSLGNIFSAQEKYNEALTYFQMALEREKVSKNLLGIAINYNNIGNIYEDQNQYDKATEYFKKSLETNRVIGSQKGIAICYNDLGDVALKGNKTQLALEYLNNALQINIQIGDQIYTSNNFISIGQAYSQTGDYKTALYNFNKGLDIALKIGAKQNACSAYKCISEAYEKMGDNSQSLKFFKKASVLNDSIRSETNLRYVDRMNIIYQSVKKDQEIKLLNYIQSIKDKKHKIIVITLITGCLFLILMSILIYFNYRLKQKANQVLSVYNKDVEEKNRILTNQKEEILAQRDEIEEKRNQINEAYEQIKLKNEDITDNIRYAVQIQNVMLPEASYMKSLLASSFVFYEPKDIVSGDFYWLAKKNGQIVLSVADCTGHGVTGAFMSILGITALNEIVVEKGIVHTDQILNLLREKIIWTLQQGGEFSESREGIHLVVCSIDLMQKRLQFSGAINSIILIRKGELLQYKGDRMPISIYPDMEDFQSTNIALEKDDMIYLFSDGYYGQFGGDDDKKFGLVRFRSMLQNISTLPANEQYEIVECTFKAWRGTSEQVDDILVMGIRI